VTPSTQIESVVLAAIRKVAPEADPAALDRQADIRDELDIDSMDFLAYVTAIHRELGVDIAEHDYPKLVSIDGAVKHLASLVNG
jgi:acyl carrier protein